MNQAALYQNANNAQRHDAQQILKEFANVFHWRLDGRDSLLDIGCGSGDVTMDFIRPLMSVNFEKLVGTDISGKMIRHARTAYSGSERVQFEVLDISSDIPKPFANEFDHITSFYCLHWVQNQQKAMQNIFQMLRSDGDCLLVFLASNPVFDVYKELSEIPKWKAFMKDVDQFIGPLHYSRKPVQEFEQMLDAAGFLDYNVQVREQLFVYDGVDLLKRNVKAVNPFIERIPSRSHDEYLNDYIKTAIKMNLAEKLDDVDDYRFISPYKLVVAYARK